MTPLPALDWIGCATALLGSALLASNTRASALGWVAYFTSNCAWIAYGLLTAQQSIVVMQVGFMATTLLGLYRHRSALARVRASVTAGRTARAAR
jgi:hypothetical protein